MILKAERGPEFVYFPPDFRILNNVVDVAKGIHHTATIDERWDGPAAVAAMPNDAEVLWYCHAWKETGGDTSAKATYKFPHHKTQGGPANLAGCRNGLARLAGAKIPEGDKDGVRAHLEAHIADGKGKSSDHSHDEFIAKLHDERKKIRPDETHNGWYKISNQGDSSAEVSIYDEIGYFGVSAEDFIDELGTLGPLKNLTIRINSQGGDVFDALAMLNYLRDMSNTHITVKIDGMAASSASFLAMAGDKVIAMPNSRMMVHNARGMTFGEAKDMRTFADMLDDVSGMIASIYAERAGGTQQNWLTAMRATTWYDAEDAKDVGLVDEVADAAKCGDGNDSCTRKKPMDRTVSLSSYSRIAAINNPVPTVKEDSDLDWPDFDPNTFKNALTSANDEIKAESWNTARGFSEAMEGLSDKDFPWDADEFKLIMKDLKEDAPAVIPAPKEREPVDDEPIIDGMMIDAAIRAAIREGR